MSEPLCHFNHNEFSPSQQCIHCSYQEPCVVDYKRDLKYKLEELLGKFKFFGTWEMKTDLYHIYLTKEKLLELKESIWYHKDVIESINNIIEASNKNENLRY